MYHILSVSEQNQKNQKKGSTKQNNLEKKPRIPKCLVCTNPSPLFYNINCDIF